MLEESKKAALEYFKKIPKDRSFSALLTAKYHVLEASVIDKENKFTEYEDAMETAIQLIKN